MGKPLGIAVGVPRYLCKEHSQDIYENSMGYRILLIYILVTHFHNHRNTSKVKAQFSYQKWSENLLLFNYLISTSRFLLF